MSAELAGKLLERNRVGALLRVFASRPEVVEEQVASVVSATLRLLSLRTGGKPTFARIDLLVSSDKDFGDSDCGLTAERLRTVVAERFATLPVSVSEIKKGDIYCMLLNYGIMNQVEDRVPYSVILSHKASSYATQENVDALLAAMQSKARVAGIAIKELAPHVRAGRVANTFAIWHNKSLMTVGGFDLIAARPSKFGEGSHKKVSGWSDAKALRDGVGAVEYYVAGCEEIIPLVRFGKFFGPSIAVVEPIPAGGHEYQWEEPDLLRDPEMYHRHHAKLATKEARQKEMAATQGVTLEVIERAVLGTLGELPIIRAEE